MKVAYIVWNRTIIFSSRCFINVDFIKHGFRVERNSARVDSNEEIVN